MFLTNFGLFFRPTFATVKYLLHAINKNIGTENSISAFFSLLVWFDFDDFHRGFVLTPISCKSSSWTWEGWSPSKSQKFCPWIEELNPIRNIRMFSPSPIPATTPGNSSNGKKFFFSLSSKCVRTSDKTCNDCRHFKVS